MEFGIGGRQGAYRFYYFVLNGAIGLNTRVTDTEVVDRLSNPLGRSGSLTYDGTNLVWAFSRAGEFFIPAYLVSASSALVNFSKLGPAIVFARDTSHTWPTTFHVLSWNVVSL